MEELKKDIYFGASAQTLKKAKLLRAKTTNAENILWERLKGKQVQNLRFRRQHPINIYIVDFYCHSQKLVIELDGGIHKTQIEYDNGRTKDLKIYGLNVIRFQNYKVENELENVISIIKNTISNSSS